MTQFLEVLRLLVWRYLPLFCSRGLGAVLQLVASVVAGRLYGPAGAGLYFLVLAWVNVVSIVVGFGFPSYALRFISKAPQRERAAYAQRLLEEARGHILALTLALSLVVLAVFWLFNSSEYIAGMDGWFVLAVLVASPAIALCLLNGDSIKAFGRANMGMVVERAIAPAVAICLMVLASLSGGQGPMVPVYSYVVAALVGAFAGSMFLPGRFSLTSPFGGKGHPDYWLLGQYCLLILTVILVGRAPYLILPLYVGGDELGYLGAALALPTMAGISRNALEAYFAPHFARTSAAGNWRLFMRRYFESQVWCVVAYAPFALLLIFAGELVLSIYGDGFSAGASMLKVLAAIKLVEMFFGPVEIGLAMIGKPKIDIVATVISLLSYLIVLGVFGGFGDMSFVVIGLFAAAVLKRLIGCAYLGFNVVAGMRA